MIEYPTKVLLATDGTDDSVMAAQVAVSLSGKTGAKLHVVHVGQPASIGSGTTVEGASLPIEPYESVVRRARRLLERQVEQIRSVGGTVSEPHLRMGQPAREVVRLSEEVGADLLVVGSGRPRPVRRAVAATMRRAALGRAADYIVRSAPCPVLVVHGDGVLRTASAQVWLPEEGKTAEWR